MRSSAVVIEIAFVMAFLRVGFDLLAKWSQRQADGATDKLIRFCELAGGKNTLSTNLVRLGFEDPQVTPCVFELLHGLVMKRIAVSNPTHAFKPLFDCRDNPNPSIDAEIFHADSSVNLEFEKTQPTFPPSAHINSQDARIALQRLSTGVRTDYGSFKSTQTRRWSEASRSFGSTASS